MSFSKAFLDELKSRIRVSDVVGRHVKLTRAGREFKGLSPFTNEKTPSFTVNDQKGFYHCFSSGSHGDAIKFLQEVRGLTFHEAVQQLADEAGMELPQQSPQEREWEKRRATLTDVMEMAAAFYVHALHQGKGRDALSYVQGRGLQRSTIDAFRMGYAPNDRTALHDHLLQKDVTPEQMLETGLVIKPDDGRPLYDRFRNRVMFPIFDARGKAIAFGGRALDANTPAKYLNSPETPLFHKGAVLYNFKRAREACFAAKGPHDGALIVAEGYMDVIALAEAGFPTAVAPLGTALTEQQMALLWKVCPEPILCFDGDRAGAQAAHRVIDRALPLLKPGHSLRFAMLPEGQDPDDLIRQGGAGAIADVLERSDSFADVLWERELAVAPYDTPERRAGLEDRLRTLLKSIQEKRIRDYYAKDFRARLDKLFDQGQGGAPQRTARGRQAAQGRRPGFRSDRPSVELKRSALVSSGESRQDPREALLVLTILNHPELLSDHFEAFAELEISHPKLDRLRSEIISLAALGEPLDRSALDNHFKDTEIGRFALDLSSQKALKSERFAQPEASVVDAERGWAHLLNRYRSVHTLQKELRDAELALAQEMTEENVARLAAVKAQLHETERDLANTDF